MFSIRGSQPKGILIVEQKLLLLKVSRLEGTTTESASDLHWEAGAALPKVISGHRHSTDQEQSRLEKQQEAFAQIYGD